MSLDSRMAATCSREADKRYELDCSDCVSRNNIDVPWRWSMVEDLLVQLIVTLVVDLVRLSVSQTHKLLEQQSVYNMQPQNNQPS